MPGETRRVIRNNMVVGLVLITPVAVTAYIVHLIFRLVAGNAVTRHLTEWTYDLLPQIIQEGTAKSVLSWIIGILLVLLILFLLGFCVRSFFGRRLYRLAEQILIRIPVFNKIYVQVRHISETIFSRRETMFNEVVLIPYPRAGLYSVAFVTSQAPADFHRDAGMEYHAEDPMVALFVPTTPNPTSGMLVFSKKSEIQPLPISVSEAMQLIVSAGAVYPGEDEGPDRERPTLLDKLEQWITRQTNLEPPAPPTVV